MTKRNGKFRRVVACQAEVVLILFIDESGDHSLKIVDPQFPIFTLAGCIFEHAYYERYAVKQVEEFKLSLFGRSELILHDADIRRARNGFEQMADPVFREEFYRRTNDLMTALDFKIVAASLKKFEHQQRYVNPAHPYNYCMECLIERYYHELVERNETGSILAESRGNHFDRELKFSFDEYLQRGVTGVPGVNLRSRILGLEFLPKSANTAGLQIADLIATPISHFVLGKTNRKSYDVLLPKFRCDTFGNYLGQGLQILPET